MEWDCKAPLNINDEDLHPAMNRLPSPESSSAYTSTSYLHHSAATLSLRIKLCAQANSLNPSASHFSFSHLISKEKSIQASLSRLPKWSQQEALHTSTLLELQLRQFLVILHTPRLLATYEV